MILYMSTISFILLWLCYILWFAVSGVVVSRFGEQAYRSWLEAKKKRTGKSVVEWLGMVLVMWLAAGFFLGILQEIPTIFELEPINL